MKKTIGLITSVAISVGLAVYVLSKNPEWVDRVMNWLFSSLGM